MNSTMPSRRFLIQQATLTALDLEMREIGYAGSLRGYTVSRTLDGTFMPWGFTEMVRSQFRKLAAQHGG